MEPGIRRSIATAAVVVASILPAAASATTGVTPAEARAIATEAYVYGYPMVDSYRIQHAYFVDSHSAEYKGPWNQVRSMARVYTPDDKAVQTPNSDTPYSMLGMDLRAEPLVLTMPPIEKGRYFSVQLVDAYTHNFAYLGSRTTGNGGGAYLIAGPNWKGDTPKGVSQVIRAETQFALAIYRTQLFNPGDLDNVKQVQAGYKVELLSAFLGQPAPAAAPALDFIQPLAPAAQKTSPALFNVLNFVLQFCPTVPSEKDLMTRFAKIGVGAGKTFDLGQFAPAVQTAIQQGIADAWSKDMAELQKKIAAKEVTSNDMFGTREHLRNNYLYRMAAAVFGIFGNSAQEAMYPMYTVDADGQKLTGSNRYTVHFAPGKFPPANAFWSLTMYDLPASLLVANPLQRYLINSPMLPQLQKDADGGLTLIVQNESPGKDAEANWLPAPQGDFMVVLRIYWPEEEALTGGWTAPPMQRRK